MDRNNKVPIAILSCFLIAFILQGTLKLSGVFVFEKALNWEIFRIIDSHTWLLITHYSLISAFNIYCLAFALTARPYSNKWYHYVLVIGSATIVTICKVLIANTAMYMQFIYDIILYIVVPFIINLTTAQKYKLNSNSFSSYVTTLAIQILLYFAYLGLGYWSGLLTSLNPVTQVALPASTHFLVRFEMYIGLVLLMLSLNLYIRKEKDMYWPVDIASKLAKKKAKRDKYLAEVEKLNIEIAELEKKNVEKA